VYSGGIFIFLENLIDKKKREHDKELFFFVVIGKNMVYNF